MGVRVHLLVAPTAKENMQLKAMQGRITFVPTVATALFMVDAVTKNLDTYLVQALSTCTYIILCTMGLTFHPC